jgi:hypothetical protein
MATIKLGQRPKTFKPITVKFEMPTGEEGVIKATYKYRTRSEFGELLNAMFKEAGKEPPKQGDEAKPLDFKELFTESGAKNAKHLLEALDAWDVEADLSLASLTELADSLPAGCAALMAAYSNACQEGRLGN